MSRTYRFNKGKDRYLVEDSWILKEHKYVWKELCDGYVWRKWSTIHIDPKSEEGKKRLARFHSDAKKGVMIWNGPSWFNKLFSQKPHRMDAKKELHKFKINPEHEVIISKPHRVYWW